MLMLVGSLMFACGGAQPPQAQMTAAQSSIRAAEVGGAEDVPKGKLHLKYARDQVTEAEKLIAEKEYEAADRVLQRAEADAKYALALAQHNEARLESQEMLEQIDELMESTK
jgi:hypothetical protein